MSTHIKYAQLRHNTWVYRRTYPKALQPLLGTALKRSLKTSDARDAKARVDELNITFDRIVAEATAHAALPAANPADTEALRLGVASPRYQRARLLGDRAVDELVGVYLQHQAKRLRPGSFKSVRFAMGLLASELGTRRIGSITAAEGRQVLRYIAELSPNIRKYRVARGKTLAELAALSQELEGISLTPQTQGRIWDQICAFLDWAKQEGELTDNPWAGLRVMAPPEPEPHRVMTDAQVITALQTKDRVLHGALLFALLTGMRSGELCGVMAEDVTAKGNLGRFLHIRPNAIRQLKSKAAEREVPLHATLEGYLDAHLPRKGRLFPQLTVDRVVKAYAKLRVRHPDLAGTVFHSTRKWFITQCERTGVPEHFTASLVGHQSARSQNRLTYGLYSAGISDGQKRAIIDGIRLPEGAL
jgi:integrase